MDIFKSLKTAAYDVLIWASAADKSILDLEQCEHAEQIKQASIGILLFITATVAGVAGGYMFFLILKDTSLSIIFGIVWGMIFFFIDRSVVSSVRKRESKSKKDFWLASPRIFLACLAATFVSYGMDLKFFESDINLEMSNHSDSLLNSYINTNNNFLKNNFDNDVNNLKEEITYKQNNFPEDLKLMIDEYANAKNNYDSLKSILIPENSNHYQQIRNIRSNYLYTNIISQYDKGRIQNLYTLISKNNSILKKANNDCEEINKSKLARLQGYQSSTDSLEKRNNASISKIEIKKDTASLYFAQAEKR